MKVSRDQVAENRRRILETAARLYRERGFEGVSVAQIMSEAGLTHGAFYGYFSSKDDLIAQTFAHVLAEDSGRPHAPETLPDYARFYLTPGHRDDRGGGCLFAGLGTDATRAALPVRDTMTRDIERQIAGFSRTAPGRTPHERRRAAIASWSAMVGAVILSRIATDPALSDEILRETRTYLSGNSS